MSYLPTSIVEVGQPEIMNHLIMNSLDILVADNESHPSSIGLSNNWHTLW